MFRKIFKLYKNEERKMLVFSCEIQNTLIEQKYRRQSKGLISWKIAIKMPKQFFHLAILNSVQNLHLILSRYFSQSCENHTMYLEIVLSEHRQGNLGENWWFYWVCFKLNCFFFLFGFLLLILIVMRTTINFSGDI